MTQPISMHDDYKTLPKRESVGVDILALDPGVTTGIAYKQGDKFRGTQVLAEQYPHPHEALFDALSNMQPKVLVYEAFHFRQNMKGAEFKGVEYIGVIELYAQMKCIDCIKITPGLAKGFWTNDKLAALDLRCVGVHANDAMRVLLTHLMRVDNEFKMDTLKKLKANL